MMNRFTANAALVAFVCATAMLQPAFAQEEGGGEDPGTELVDPVPDNGTGEDVGGEVTIDDGILNDGDGDIAVEDGEVVPYGPDDCIDCNVAPTTVNVTDRPEGENYRGDLVKGVTTTAIDAGNSADGDSICDHTKTGDAAKICP
jgi:hypothetical protein